MAKEFNVQDYLKTPEDRRLFLEASFMEDPGNGSGVRLALREIAKAEGVYNLSKRTGITPQGIYKALNETGNPSLTTIMQIVHALGLKLTVIPA